MHSHKETKCIDDYLRRVCQAIEKYDTQELVAYLAHGQWSVITDQERNAIEKEATKELKLLMLRRIIRKDESRIKKLREVLKNFASNVNTEVLAAISSDIDDDRCLTKKRITDTMPIETNCCSNTSVFNSRVQVCNGCLKNCYTSECQKYEKSDCFFPTHFVRRQASHLNEKPVWLLSRGMDEVKQVDLAHGVRMLPGYINVSNSHSDSEWCHQEHMSSGSDMSESPMDCSQMLLMDKHSEHGQTLSDIDYGYRSMTTIPCDLTQSSGSTHRNFCCTEVSTDPDVYFSLPLTCCSSSDSCVSGSMLSRRRPWQMISDSSLKEDLQSMKGVKLSPRCKHGLHDVDAGIIAVGANPPHPDETPQGESQLHAHNSAYVQYHNHVHINHFHGCVSRHMAPPHGNSNAVQSRTVKDEELCEQTGVRSLEPYVTLSVEDKILKRNNADLMQYMNMPVLLPHLYENCLVTQEEYQILSRDSPTTFDKHGYFLQSVLPHKSPDAFDRLLHCFKAETQHCGHQYLAELLEKERQKASANPTVSQCST